MESNWRHPQDWSGIDWPKHLRGHGKRARLLVDYGSGECEVAGRAYLSEDGEALVFSDIGGWTTDHVKGWKLSELARDEIDEDQERED